MSNRLIKILTIIIFPLLIVVGFSSWIIVGNKSENLGQNDNSYNPIAVAYISDNPAKTYTRIEKALEIANGTATEANPKVVVVIPNLKHKVINDSGVEEEVLYPISITSSCTIGNNVTLSLPYNETGDVHYEGTFASNKEFADSTIEKVKINRKTQVILENNITLRISPKGSLMIGGITGNTGQDMVGHTYGSYSELTLKEGASILSEGNIECYGYIKNSSNNNTKTIVNLIEGTLKLPFIIYDFKGGTNTATLHYCEVCPFSIYDIANVQVKMRITSKSIVKGEIRLTIDADNTHEVTVIGGSYFNNALILTSGYVDLKYTPNDPDNVGITQPYTDLNSNGFLKAELYGSLIMGGISLFVSIKGISATINTNDYYFPVPYPFDFDIKSGSDLNIGKRTKFMQGSSLEVEDGAYFNISNNVAFLPSTTLTDVDFKYPTEKATAQLINDGIIEIESGCLAANITSSSSRAIINNKSSTYSLSLYEFNQGFSATDVGMALIGGIFFNKDSKLYKYTIEMTGNITNIGENAKFSNSNAQTGSYVSTNNNYWTKYTTSLPIKYYKVYYEGNSNPLSSPVEYINSSLASSCNLSDTISNISNLSNESEYYFAGWYLDNDCEEKVIEKNAVVAEMYKLSSGEYINLYAKMSKVKPINVTYYGGYSNTSDETSFSLNYAHSVVELYVPGETIYMKEPVQNYAVYEGNNVSTATYRDYYTFNGWNVKNNNSVVISDNLSWNEEFEIPLDYASDTLSIQWTRSTNVERHYKIYIEDTNSAIVNIVNVLNFDPSVLSDEAQHTFWVKQGAQVVVIIIGYEEGLFIKREKTNKCDITSNEKINITDFSATGNNTAERSFIMPDEAVTISASKA